METDINNLLALPDISVIDGITVDGIQTDMITDFEGMYQKETGESITLHPADKDRIKLNAVANKLFQAYQCIDKGFRMNFIRYSYGNYLKHLGARDRIFKQESKPAVTVLRFTLQETRAQATAIPAGKRATAGDNLFFATDDYAEIGAGNLYVDVHATCTQAGAIGNHYMPGQINEMVDKIPYIERVENIVESEGGSDEESDADFKVRVFLAPSSYSTAGPEDAYIYWVKQYNSAAIGDVKAMSTEGGEVNIRVVLTGGILPSEAFLAGLTDFLASAKVRPSTDKVIVSAPDVVEYDLDFTYYIGKSNKYNVEAIQKAAEDAKDAYITWQRGHIGVDINTDVLVEFLRAAGVKRAVIRNPSYTVVQDTEIAVVANVSMIYGGLEDD